MKDYAWKLAERYPNHEKHMSLRDGVEMEVEGHGDRWTWNVRTVTGAYIAKDGRAESLREAKGKAEGAADGARSLAKHAGHAKFRVVYLGAYARRAYYGDPTGSIDIAKKMFTRLKNQGRTAWIETDSGEFVPIPRARRKPAEHQ